MNLNWNSWLVFYEIVGNKINYYHLIGFEEIPNEETINPIYPTTCFIL